MNYQEKKWFQRLNEKKINHAKVFMDPEYRSWWSSVIDKYPDSAHFIYELLQNADDAKATKAEVRLLRNGILFKHNGSVRFNVSDPDNYEEDKTNGLLGHVNSLTSIGMSTKKEGSNDNKIGKFGVGFKAVFQYTRSPEIYDDNICFRLKDYIIPEQISHDHEWRKHGETLFYLPFDREDLPAQKAYGIIESKLKNLNNPILFLNHLKKITWNCENGGVEGVYFKNVIEKSVKGSVQCEKIVVKGFNGKQDTLWLFSKQVEVAEDIHSISVGYYIDGKGKVDTQRRPKIFCYFPTSESLDSCFIMHAPFALVDNRQQIKREEEVNDELFYELSRLAAKALELLCVLAEEHNKQWLDENIFEIVPLQMSYGDDDEVYEKWFNYFYTSFLDTLSHQAVHLSSESKYVTVFNARKADDSIRQLLTIEQFNQLISSGTKRHLYYVHTKLKKNDKVDKYLSSIELEAFDMDDFGDAFNEAFIRVQDDEWLMRFYKFLLTDSAKRLIAHYKLNFFNYSKAQLLTKPCIRTSTKKFVAPYTASGKANVFVSDGSPFMEGMNYVDPVLCAEKDFQELLRKLNIPTPDGKHYVESVILPKYAGSSCLWDDVQYKKDFCFICNTYYRCTGIEVDEYLKLIEQKFKFKCLNGHFHHIEDVIYEKNEHTSFLSNSVASIHILDRDFYRSIKEISEENCIGFLNRFDFCPFLQVLEITVNEQKDIDQILSRIDGHSKYELGSPDITDFSLDTFDECCNKNKVTEEYSLFVWNSLFHLQLDVNQWMSGDCTYQPFNDGRYKRKSCTFESTLSISIRKNRWLYNKKGELCSPKKVFVEDLSSRYTISETMVSLIGLKHSPQTQDMKLIAEKCSKQTLEATKIGQLLLEEGIKDTEEVHELIEWRREKKRLEDEQKRAEEKKKKEEEERKKMLELHSDYEKSNFTHKQNSYSIEDAFDQDANTMPAKPNSSEPASPVDFERQIKQLQETEEEKQRLNQIATDNSKLYTYEWFTTLLEMEFNASGEENRGKRGIEINFSRVEKDPYSEHGVLLKNPSRRIPISIEEMNNIAVTFRLPDDIHQTVVFEVASVQDYVLRLKCKNEDIGTIDTLMSLSNRIYRAELKTETPVQLIAKLQEAFFDLQLPNEYSMLDNINPTIKFIFGPPGTGKTTHLVKKWINQVAMRPRGKMLILCPTNKAADVIANKAFALIDKRSHPEEWLFRFVATNEDALAEHVCMRESNIWEANKCCIISTIARFAYDGFDEAKLKDIKWDYIVIDEASMIPLAQIIYPIYQCRDSQIIIAGDPMQIEPIVHEELWKDENIYKMVHLESFINPVTRPVQFDILKLPTQYRAVPAIGNLYSKYAYNGGVASDRQQSSQQKISLGNYVVMSVNFIPFPVERTQSIYSTQPVGTSNVHIYAALFAFEFTQYIAKCLSMKDSGKPWRIGIVSPYHAQAEVMNKLWEQRKDPYSHVEVVIGTVHGFQGDECDIIIAVYNPPASGMKRAFDKTFINRKNILNVAISRAQDYLFLLMPDPDYEYYNNLQAKNIGRIAKENKDEMTYKTAQEVEKYMFGDSNHIEKNTFVTTHQLANVYTAPSSKYEVRIDDKSIDIQIK